LKELKLEGVLVVNSICPCCL